jgi:hypothetical protein
MTMFNYLFPIFAFGIVITGIVFLGLQQASDWAKELVAARREVENKSKNSAAISPEVNSATAQVLTGKSRL